MVPTRSSSPRQAPHRMLVTLATAVLVAASLAIAPVASAAPPGPSGPPTGSCDLQSKGDKIQHVIYLQFDNVHFERDNPNVPSDIEQMPHLYNFLKDNGTFDTNDHTILISHTGGGILSSLTGLYPDRHGQAVSNSYGYFNPAAQPAESASRPRSSTGPTTPTAATRRTARRRRLPTRTSTWSTPTRPRSAAPAPHATRPAPWVPYTRAGCDVGNVSVANTVLENNTAIVFRNAGTDDPRGGQRRRRDEHQGRQRQPGSRAGQTLVLETGDANNELATIATVGTAGSGGTGVNLAAPAREGARRTAARSPSSRPTRPAT